jgi:hypothetical protein
MKESMKADHIIVTLTCTFEVRAAEVERLAEAAIRVRELPGGGIRFAVHPMSSFVEADALARQEKFEEAIRSHLASLTKAGVSGELVRSLGGYVNVSISLCPASGQAGIVLTPEILSQLSLLSAVVYIDAMC